MTSIPGAQALIRDQYGDCEICGVRRQAKCDAALESPGGIEALKRRRRFALPPHSKRRCSKCARTRAARTCLNAPHSNTIHPGLMAKDPKKKNPPENISPRKGEFT